MIEFVPFAPCHLEELALQPGQAHLAPLLVVPGYAQALARGVVAVSGLVEGRVVGCAGVTMQWAGRGLAWALFGPTGSLGGAGSWRQIVRRTVATLDDAHAKGFWRLEATVDVDFVAGHRFARLAGFEREAVLAAYSPEARDMVLYRRLDRRRVANRRAADA